MPVLLIQVESTMQLNNDPAKQELIKEVLGKLPHHTAIRSQAKKLGAQLKASQLEDVRLNVDESLTNWFQRLPEHQSQEILKLRLVVGQTRTDHRGDRRDWKRKMVRAASTDGAAGFALLPGLLRQSPSLPESGRLDLDFFTDECEDAPKEIANSHLVVVGTGEVNLLATYLERLFFNFIRFSGTPADRLTYRKPGKTCSILRSESDCFNHPGAVLLLKNPWNPAKRLLWLAGLTGYGTSCGARLIGSENPDFQKNAAESCGVIYCLDHHKTKTTFHGCFQWQDDKLLYRPSKTTRSKPAPASSPHVEHLSERKATPKVLAHLRKYPEATQQQIATAVRASVGLVNRILKKNGVTTIHARRPHEQATRLSPSARQYVEDSIGPLSADDKETGWRYLMSKANPKELQKLENKPAAEKEELIKELIETLNSQQSRFSDPR